MALKDTAIRMALVAPGRRLGVIFTAPEDVEGNLPARHQAARHHRRTMHVPHRRTFPPGTMDSTRSAAMLFTAAWQEDEHGPVDLNYGRSPIGAADGTEARGKS